jgi:hypothetical protein
MQSHHLCNGVPYTYVYDWSLDACVKEQVMTLLRANMIFCIQ